MDGSHGTSQEINFEDLPESYFDDVVAEFTVQGGLEDILASDFRNQPTGNNHPPLPPYSAPAKPKVEYDEPEAILPDVAIIHEQQTPRASAPVVVSSSAVPLRIEGVQGFSNFTIQTGAHGVLPTAVSASSFGKLPISVSSSGARYVTVPVSAASGSRSVVTLNGGAFPAGVRPMGGKYFAVPISAAGSAGTTQTSSGKVLQKIAIAPKPVAVSSFPPGITGVRVATASQLASIRGSIPAAPAPRSTAFRSARPVLSLKTMPGHSLNGSNMEALLRNAVPIASSSGTAMSPAAITSSLEKLPPSLRKGPIVLSTIPGTSTLQPIELPANASSLIHAGNTVQRFIQIGGKLTPVQVIEDQNLAHQLSLIRVQPRPKPQAPPAPLTQYPVAADTALMDHNFAASASSRPQAKKPVGPKVKPPEPTRWNRSEINVGDFLNPEVSKMKEVPLEDLLPAPENKTDNKKEPKEPPPKGKKTCNCTKSQCLKLYCECFSSGEFCIGCNCLNCRNNIENEEERQRAVAHTLERNPTAFRPKIGPVTGAIDGKRHQRGCNCKKSYCLKNYCECFEAKILCTHLCRCQGCKNQGDETSRQVLIHLCDAADQEAKFRRQSRLSARFTGAKTDDESSAGRDSVQNPREPEKYEHALPPETFSFHHAPDMDGVWEYFRSEVIEATCLCLIGKGKEAVDQGLNEEQVQRAIIDECKRCLDQIIRHAQGEQQRFLEMEKAAERAASRVKRSVARFEEEMRESNVDEGVGKDVNGVQEEVSAEPSPSPAKKLKTRGDVRRALL